MFFAEPTVNSLVEAIVKFEAAEHRFSPRFIRAHAEQFDKKHFLTKMERFVAEKLGEFATASPEPFHPVLAATKPRG